MGLASNGTPWNGIAKNGVPFYPIVKKSDGSITFKGQSFSSVKHLDSVNMGDHYTPAVKIGNDTYVNINFWIPDRNYNLYPATDSSFYFTVEAGKKYIVLTDNTYGNGYCQILYYNSNSSDMRYYSLAVPQDTFNNGQEI